MVGNPKEGKQYRFTFAGTPLLGILEGEDDKLSKNYGERWYWFKVPVNMDPTAGREMRYPVSIHSILGEV